MIFNVTFQEVDHMVQANFGEVVMHPCVVTYSKQELTEEQKAQARENIGATATGDTVVDFSKYYTKDEVDALIPESGGTGADGFSPIAKVTQTAEGATIEITDKDGTTTATVTNGKNGLDGKDGYTPIKGVDYFDGKDGANGKDYVLTDADKDEIAQMAVSLLPVYDGSYTKGAIE